MYKIHLIGNLTRDPEKGKEFNGEPSVKFSVAANNIRGGKKIVSYFDCIAFGGKAKFAMYLRKGNPVYIEGEPSIYVGKDGKGTYDVYVQVLESMSNKSNSSDSGLEDAPVRAAQKEPAASADVVDVTEQFLRSGNIVPPPAPEPVENVKLPWDDGRGDDSDLPF